jgi:hypothetical protein
MQRILLVAALFPFIALPADKQKPGLGPLLSLDRIYAKKEFSSTLFAK